MCQCKRLEVSSVPFVGGMATQTCLDCGKSKDVPVTMDAIINYIKTQNNQYRHAVNKIETFLSRSM